jgi:holo-[acyl-carrier protein] synthase
MQMTKNSINTYNIRGLGTDIIEIQRIKEAIARHGDPFLNRIFTEKEREYCQRYKDATSHFAGRFAAKEAVLKACGKGLHSKITWKEIEILNDAEGKPEVQLPLQLKQGLSLSYIFLSISHCDAYATATAIAVG